MKETYKLYNGEVTLVHDSDAERNRYIVTDTKLGIVNQPVRGVTTALKDIFNKPGLQRWPLDMAMKYLFGAKWDDLLLKLVADGSGQLTQYDEVTLSVKEGLKIQELLDNCYAASRNKSQAGRDTGTQIHAAIEQYLNELPAQYDVPIEIAKSVKAFINWCQKQNIQSLKVEQPIYSRQYQFAGRYDALLDINGKVTLVDFKTNAESSYALKDKDGKWTGIYPDNFVQLGAYILAYIEELEAPHREAASRRGRVSMDKWHVDDLMVINVTKEGKIHTISASELGMTVGDCEQDAARAIQLHDSLAKMYRVKPTEIHQEVANV